MRSRSQVSRAAGAVVLAAIALTTTAAVRVLQAQETGRIGAAIKIADNALEDRPVMVSFVRDGAIVYQGEVLLVASPNQTWISSKDQPPGVYDVRVEGDGIVTEVKRGVQVFPRRDTPTRFMLRPGEGAHIVEYAIGGLAREEVAARLVSLESAVSEIREAVATKP